MSAFEDFVQIELARRPYLEADVAQETVLVRRGVGPRQLSAVTLSEGQVLAFVGGALVGVVPSTLGNTVRKAVLTVSSASSMWSIPHNKNSLNAIVQVVDSAGFVILPSEIKFVDVNTIEVYFNTAQTGIARVIFLD